MYSDILNKMTIAKLKEEADKYPGIEITSKDKKQDIINKILEKYYVKDKKAEEENEFPDLKKEKVGETLVKRRDSNMIGFDGEAKPERFMTPYQKCTYELVENKARGSKPLTAQIKGWKREVGKNGKFEYFINAIYGETQRIITIPFTEYKLETRSLIDVVLKSEHANRVNKKASKNIRAEVMTDEEIIVYINKRAFSKCSFYVTDIDTSDDFGDVLGSRTAAAKKDQLNWDVMIKQGDGSVDFWMKEGKQLEVRVCSVESYGIYVESFGYEFFIPKASLSYNPRADMKYKFRIGQYLTVMITRVERDSRGRFLAASLSHIALFDNPAPKIVSKLKKGETVFGIVMDQEYDPEWGYRSYVEYQDNVNIACRTDRSVGIVPHKGDKVALKIFEKDDVKGQARGYIQHVYPVPFNED